MNNKEYYNKLHDDGLVTNLYISYLSKKYGESIDKERSKNEILAIHQKLKMELDEADFHVRLITTPVTNINSTEVYTMKETEEILRVSRGQLRDLIHRKMIIANQHNQRNWTPFKWSVDSFANGFTNFISIDNVEYQLGDCYVEDEIEYVVQEIYYKKNDVLDAISNLLTRRRKIIKYLKD